MTRWKYLKINITSSRIIQYFKTVYILSNWFMLMWISYHKFYINSLLCLISSCSICIVSMWNVSGTPCTLWSCGLVAEMFLSASVLILVVEMLSGLISEDEKSSTQNSKLFKSPPPLVQDLIPMSGSTYITALPGCNSESRGNPRCRNRVKSKQ